MVVYRFVILRADGSVRIEEVLNDPTKAEIDAKQLEFKNASLAGERYGHYIETPPRVVTSVSSDIDPIEAIGGQASESVTSTIETRG